MKRKYCDLKLRIGYIIQGIKTIKEFHIGDIVEYKGVSYFVNNAIKSDSKGVRIYDLVENVPCDENNSRKCIELKKYEFYKVKCWSNFKRGIMNVYEFNMTYWHDINLRKMLGN